MPNVVKHARRKYDVEGVRFGRDAIIFDKQIIVGVRMALFADREAAFRHVGRCERNVRKVRPKEWYGVADSGAEVAYPRHADVAAIDNLSQLLDLIFGEELRTLACYGYVLAVLLIVLFGEAIKFDVAHVAITVPLRRVVRSAKSERRFFRCD